MSKICIITNKKSIVGNKRSHSMNSKKRIFLANIQKKKFWSEKNNKYIKIFVSKKGIKMIKKKGIDYFYDKIKR
ncbi:MAG: 50S ribosomal protein L28 [Enterobacteriaceae bacterium]